MSKKLASNNHTTGSVKRNKYLEGSESNSSSDSRPTTKRSSSGSNNQSKQSRRAQKRKWDDDYEFPEPAMTSDSDQDWEEEEKAGESSSSSDSDPMWSPAQRSVMHSSYKMCKFILTYLIKTPIQGQSRCCIKKRNKWQ